MKLGQLVASCLCKETGYIVKGMATRSFYEWFTTGCENLVVPVRERGKQAQFSFSGFD